VSIGLEEKGESILGVVYDPILDQLFTGVLRGGAHLNGAPILPGAAETISAGVIATGLVYDVWDSGRGIPEIVELIKRARSIRINGSAALDLCYVACGRLDAYCDSGLYPWDISAARVIVAEAGGTFTLYGDSPDLPLQYCIAANGKLHGELEKLLIPKQGTQ
jgi:myo-inositol-1(or 4)-monophosphatase